MAIKLVSMSTLVIILTILFIAIMFAIIMGVLPR